MSYAEIWVTAWDEDQAAFCAGASVTSTPFLNVTPWMSLGNWFSPFSLRQVFAAAMTSLNRTSPGCPVR